MKALEGKTALVAGALSGIGRGVVMALARSGANVVLNYWDWPERLPSLAADIAELQAPHLVVRTDLTDTRAVPGLVTRAVERFGGLDILINNIERGGWPIVHGAYHRSQWDMELATTLRAKQWLFNSALPHLKASGDGSVVTLSSIAGMVGRSGPASLVYNEGYAAANRGISLLTETWARLGAPQVRVNEIMLGLIETRHGPRTRGWDLLDRGQRQALKDHTLLGRIGCVDDVVRAIMFVLTEAPYLTGSVIRLDGGYVLGGDPVGPMPEGVEPAPEE